MILVLILVMIGIKIKMVVGPLFLLLLLRLIFCLQLIFIYSDHVLYFFPNTAIILKQFI